MKLKIQVHLMHQVEICVAVQFKLYLKCFVNRNIIVDFVFEVFI